MAIENIQIVIEESNAVEIAIVDGTFFRVTFDELEDTPNSKIASRFITTNSSGDAIEYLNPTLSGGDAVTITNEALYESPIVDIQVSNAISKSGGALAVIPGNGVSVSANKVDIIAGDGVSVAANKVDVVTGSGIEIDSGAIQVDSTVARDSNNVVAGDGLSGGGSLTANPELTVNANRGLSVASDNVGVALNPDSGLNNGSTLSVDINGTTQTTTLTGSDTLLVQTSAGLRRVTRDNLLSGVGSGIEIRGVCLPTSSLAPNDPIPVNGDPLNTQLSQGTAPTFGGVSPNGFTYIIQLEQADHASGVSMAIGGPTGSPVTLTMFDQDQLIWLNNQWFHLETGDSVISVFGRFGSVTAQTGDYTANQITNVPAGDITSTNVQDAINEINTLLDGKSSTVHQHDHLEFSGMTKVAATNTGATVTGQIVADSANVSGAASVNALAVATDADVTGDVSSATLNTSGAAAVGTLTVRGGEVTRDVNYTYSATSGTHSISRNSHETVFQTTNVNQTVNIDGSTFKVGDRLALIVSVEGASLLNVRNISGLIHVPDGTSASSHTLRGRAVVEMYCFQSNDFRISSVY